MTDPAGEPRDLVVIGIPIDCVGAPTPDDAPFGTELAPAALRAAGVVAALTAQDGGDLDVRLTGRDRDLVTGVLAWRSVREVTGAVRAEVHRAVAGGRVPVLLGGCCTLLPGALAGARDAHGPVGLAYLDGHLDLYDGDTSPTGEPADMPIAVVVGHGPPAWADDVDAPLVAADRLVLLGPRDRDEAVALGSALPEQLGMQPELTPSRLRAEGPAAAGRNIRDRLTVTPGSTAGAPAGATAGSSAGRYWVHLDVDVLDEREFPATDYLMSGGLTRTELGEVLTPLTRSPNLIGFSLACYNPQKDADGECGGFLTDLLGQVLG